MLVTSVLSAAANAAEFCVSVIAVWMSSSSLVSMVWIASASMSVPVKEPTAASKSAMSLLIVFRSEMTVEASRAVSGVEVVVRERRRERRMVRVGLKCILPVRLTDGV